MVARFVATALAAATMCACAAPAAAIGEKDGAALSIMAPQVTAAVDDVLSGMIGEKGIPGAVIGISEKGKIAFLKGYGIADLEHGVPTTKDSVFVTGSIGKQMTSATILLLAEQGKLSIDDRLSKYLPEFPRSDEVTLKQMMNHTSGISDETSSVFLFINTQRTKDDVLKVIMSADPLYDFEPGTKWSYSNSAYILLGAVIETATGEKFEEVVKKLIFKPLGMTNSSYNDLSDIVPHRSRGYWKDKSTGQLRNAPATSLTGIIGGAGGIRSTAEDLLKFEDALFSGRLVSSGSLRLLMTPAHLSNGELATHDAGGKPLPYRYGLGTITSERVAGYEVRGQNGAQPGYYSWSYQVVGSDMTLVVLTNASGASAVATRLIPAIMSAKANTKGR